MSQFVHLHNYSHYSLLDSASTIEGLIKSAVEQKNADGGDLQNSKEV